MTPSATPENYTTLTDVTLANCDSGHLRREALCLNQLERGWATRSF
jgi:hypothetical protein